MSAARIAILLLVSLAVAAPSAAQEGASAKGTLSGRVVDENGRPVPNATVSATPLGDFDYVNRLATMSDDDGKFSLEELAPASYGFYVEAPGYVMADEARERYRIGEEVSLRVVKGGVITGTVTGPDGEPLVGVVVRALQVRTLVAGKDVPADRYARIAYADDRGIYRIYGLAAGAYVVSACGNGGYTTATAYDDDAPTYFPSSTRAGASEVTVQVGEEVRGIDIRHRGGRAHAIGGTLSGPNMKAGAYGIVTVSNLDGSTVATGDTQYTGDPWTFSVTGVPDGEYTVQGMRYGEEPALSEGRRVTVKGADVTNVALSLVAFGSVSGRAVLDPPGARPAECEPTKTGRRLEESVVAVVREVPQTKELRWQNEQETAPGRDGAFGAKSIAPGRYRIEASPADEDWYVAAVTAGKATAAKRAADAGRDGIEIAPGRAVSDVEVRLSRGAAGVRGRVSAPEGSALPARLVVHLVPADPKLAADVVRYREAEVGRDGTFAIASVAPGRYWVLAAIAPEPNEAKPAPRRAAWQADTRAALRRAAETAAQPLDLGPCQRLGDVTVHVVP